MFDMFRKKDDEEDRTKVQHVRGILMGSDQDAKFDLFLAPAMVFTHQELVQGYKDIKAELKAIQARRADLATDVILTVALLLETYKDLVEELDNRDLEAKKCEDESTESEEEESEPKASEIGPLKKRLNRRGLPLHGNRSEADKAGLNNENQENGSPTEEQTICASGNLCGMPKGTPLNLKKHKCKTCGLALHGCLCRVAQTKFEEQENICYCLKCGRPVENGPPPPPKLPPPKLPPSKRYNTRKREAKALQSPSQDNPYAKEYNVSPPKKSKRRAATTTAKTAAAKTAAAKTAATAAAADTTLKQGKVVKPRAINMKNGVNRRRSVKSPPPTLASMKDNTVRDKCTSCANAVSKLQNCNTTMKDKRARDYLPKSRHFMWTYDEMVEQPRYARNSLYIREEPLNAFLVPEDINLEKLGDNLIRVGKEMKKTKSAIGKGYVCTRDPNKYIELIFGKKKPKKTKGKKKK